MDKDFLSDVSLDFLDEQDEMIDIRNDEQFKYSQSLKRLDRIVEQNRKINIAMVPAVVRNICQHYPTPSGADRSEAARSGGHGRAWTGAESGKPSRAVPGIRRDTSRMCFRSCFSLKSEILFPNIG